MAQSLLKRSDLVSFEGVAAGHDGVLADPSGSLVIKPCTAAEIAFYEKTIAEHPDFAEYLPTFMGTLQLGPPGVKAATTGTTEELQLAATMIVAMDGSADGRPVAIPGLEQGIGTTGSLLSADARTLKGKKLETDLAIVLENVAAGFTKPNILDVKIGARLWADDARPEKRAKLEKLAGETTSGSLGFRIAGMRVWQGNKLGYRTYDKTYGRAFTTDTVSKGFESFLFPEDFSEDPRYNMRELVLRAFEEEVNEIHQLLQSKESRIYSASLLFVYEGDPNALEKAVTVQPVTDSNPKGDNDSESGADYDDNDEEEEEKPKTHALRLIDFAHASWTPGGGPDENMLQGVQSIAKILHDLKPP